MQTTEAIHSQNKIQAFDSLVGYLEAQRSIVDRSLSELLGGSQDLKHEKVIESARYSLMLPSKRLRPLFCLETCRALTGSIEAALPAACALEMVHTYSLIHDDLPCMDNDDLRRGKPTNHKVYGEATATLAGDGLLTMAFEVLARYGNASSTIRMDWVKELAQAAGMSGMVLGQQWDMEPVRDSSVAALEALHLKKTGALIAASVAMGAISAQVHEEKIKGFRDFGYDVGLAFQIRDDVLDVIGGQEIGKPLKSDERNQKPTYVSVLGIERAKEAADLWYKKALEKLKSFELPHENRLEELTRFVIERKV